ncbi:MAG TPA: hypothetical protein VF520_12965 [Thermoleophilaceae bacterium]
MAGGGPGRLGEDQRALLELMVERGLGYDALSRLLGVDRDAVRERARSALDELVPDAVVRPPESDRAELTDFLLEQGSGAPAALGTPDGREWTRAASAGLRSLAEPGASAAAKPAEPVGSAWRLPELVVPFAVYVLLIAGGLVTYAVIGLTHH